ncbi:MAG: alkaline phosphatase family protein [Phycisphaerae bacterium]
MSLTSSFTTAKHPGSIYTRRRGPALGVLLLAALIVLAWPAPAQAYIGPGAGFAVLSSFLVVLTAMVSAFFALLTWPIRWAVRWFRGRKAFARARIRRMVVLGLDGMSPVLVDEFMAAGLLPNLKKLAEQGTYRRLGTTLPPLSPVAWSSFLTGSNPGKHNIYDFLTRDKRNYMPSLSSVHISGGKKPIVRLLRKGVPFWNVLGQHGIFSNVIRVPITFPPEKFHGVLLSAMCVPDLRGSQGTFSYYTTASSENREHTGGEQIQVTRKGNRIDSYLVGPALEKNGTKQTLRCPFGITLNGNGSATLTVGKETRRLKPLEYTDWVPVTFKAGVRTKVHGICEFLLLGTEPDFELYVTPIQIDPAEPAMPISHPTVFSIYLAKKQGLFATLGLAEDTWAHNEKILEDPDFLHQCIEADTEREGMFFDALEKTKRGLVCCVFDGTDRIQHMFWRYIDPDHPARNGQGDRQTREAIKDLYLRMDQLVGKTMAKCRDDNTVLMVISDHGFGSFRRGVDLNRWLIENGYLVLKEGADPNQKYLAAVDFSKTKAFALGLAGFYLNIKGRESQGIVDPADAPALRAEICEKLGKLIDDQTGETAITTVYDTRKCYSGPYTEEAPDIIPGYNLGYRVGWETAVGQITESVFHDNVKAWSGDHCLDPKLVPGVLFCNRPIESEAPRLMDLGPTVLDLFGVDVPRHMDGQALQVGDLGTSRPARQEQVA